VLLLLLLLLLPAVRVQLRLPLLLLLPRGEGWWECVWVCWRVAVGWGCDGDVTMQVRHMRNHSEGPCAHAASGPPQYQHLGTV